MVRGGGIEPASPVCRTGALPLDEPRVVAPGGVEPLMARFVAELPDPRVGPWCPYRELNPALPLERRPSLPMNDRDKRTASCT